MLSEATGKAGQTAAKRGKSHPNDMISFGQTEPSSLCPSKRYRRQTPIPTLEGGASNLGRRLLPISGVTSRPPDGGRSKSDCPSIVSSTASLGRFTPIRRNSIPGGINRRLGAQPMPQLRKLTTSRRRFGGRGAGLFWVGVFFVGLLPAGFFTPP